MILTLFIITGLIASTFLFMQQSTFGSDPAASRMERIRRSSNYRDGSFQNLEKTEVMRENASYVGMMSDFFNKAPDNTPPKPLPSVRTDLKALSDSVPTIVWFGHSSYLIKSKGVTILVDPVFSGNASPVSFFGKAFPGSDVYKVDDMPEKIDMLVLSHDHYDHLDYLTIKQLIPRVKKFYTALGVGAHLERWGASPDQIVEFDWWESHHVDTDIDMTAVPARHFSGRSLARGRTLWTAFALKLHGYSLYLGGDSGYGKHFKEIGDKYGPFDLAILECGQYGKDWPNIHMFPEEVATVAQELHAKTVLPVHWAKFSLSVHGWTESVDRFTKRATEQKLNVTTPMIGEPIAVGVKYPKSTWWKY
ncbi:MBL fold metallo-hydrolase [Spirosoma fluviale]|uniref:L-ascorbate metabolism protein UlaG, beta-lactamase superfamily n=1 Tax=Spirosoma fluviale TaxID=1597977 RepID=A0A286F7E6_9BACT|nr:MBL fold metallo-hydrolase [Spirosoma fluviale]SOD79161.1 L-ascorbate metabolism protein UlaG, beta-lactamase superfamily [Spirosoma fluviale]